MRRLLLILAALALIAATPDEVITDLEVSGFHVEDGSGATPSVVSDAVFEGRAAGGRLYVVVLATEPGGGATTFADSVLDRLPDGYVLVVAPETVGFAGQGSAWTAEQLNRAVDAALDGSNDNEVVRLFIDHLTGQVASPSEPSPVSSGGSILPWLLVLIGGAILFFWWMSRRSGGGARSLEPVKEIARAKLADVANDIIDLEDEVRLSENADVRRHYQGASETYSTAMADVEAATTAEDLIVVSAELDEAIWELDCVEALLDGKPPPPKPEPPAPVSVPLPGEPPAPPPPVSYQRRPQRQASSGSGDMLAVLMAILASRGGGGPAGGSSPGWRSGGPWSGSGRGGVGGGPPGGPGSGGMGRIRGGGRRRG